MRVIWEIHSIYILESNKVVVPSEMLPRLGRKPGNNIDIKLADSTTVEMHV